MKFKTEYRKQICPQSTERDYFFPISKRNVRRDIYRQSRNSERLSETRMMNAETCSYLLESAEMMSRTIDT
jgi:hypothetical protein